MLENAQRMATRLVPELRGLSYRERLVKLNLSTLDYRRKRFDIIQVFKIIHKIDDIDMNFFFSFAENTQLRGHNLKLKKPRANKSVRANSFALRNIPVWNSLPTENSKPNLTKSGKIEDMIWLIYINIYNYVNIITIQPEPMTSKNQDIEGNNKPSGLNNFPYHQQGINKV